MNIGIITRHLDLPVGLGTYATNLLTALARYDKTNSYTIYTPNLPKRATWPKNFHFKRFSVEPRRSKLTWWEHVTAPLAAKGDGVDLIHYFNTATPLPLTRRPVLTNVHDAIGWAEPGYRLPWQYDLLARRDIKLSSHILTFSEHAKRDIHQLLGTPLEKISVTLEAGPAVEATSRPKKPYWLFVGGLEKRKDLRSLLDAYAQLGNSRLRIKVVGPLDASPIHDDRAELEAVLTPAQRCKIDWLGRVPGPQLTRLYREAAALVFPSVYEGFGLPVLEAMARRTPVIAANASSIPEVAGDGAILVPPRDPLALADAMRRLQRRPALRRQLVARGAAIAKEFSWQRTAEETVAVYRTLVSGS